MTNQIIQQNSLIPVQEENGALWVDARMLHAALQIGRDFSTWITGRLEEVDAVENEDFIVLDGSPVLGKTPGGRPRRDYWLSLDIAKEIAMLERNEVGKAIRRYFIETEKAYKASQRPAIAMPDFTDPVAAARAWADRAEAERKALAEKAAAEQQLALAAPKVEAFDALMDSSTTYLVREAAKLLGLGQNRLYNYMRQWGLIIPGTCEPYQPQVEAGRFVIKTLPYMRGNVMASSKTTYVTTRGLEYLRRRLAQEGVAA